MIWGNDLTPIIEENEQPALREIMWTLASVVMVLSILLTVIFWEPQHTTPQATAEQIVSMTPEELARQTAIINAENERRTKP